MISTRRYFWSLLDQVEVVHKSFDKVSKSSLSLSNSTSNISILNNKDSSNLDMINTEDNNDEMDTNLKCSTPLTSSSPVSTTDTSSLKSAIRLVCYTISLFTIFITWGYLQEKITSSEVNNPFYLLESNQLKDSLPSSLKSSPTLRWNYPFVLNLCMSFCATISSYIITKFQTNSSSIIKNEEKNQVNLSLFWKVSLFSTLASPLGYFSLNFISYPLMILMKTSKAIPVMVVGIFLYKKKYPLYKYVSVLLVCFGILFYTLNNNRGKDHDKISEVIVNNEEELINVNVNREEKNSEDIVIELSFTFLTFLFNLILDKLKAFSSIIGFTLLLLNLLLDGIVNNEQDNLFSSYSLSPLIMMFYTNYWQSIYLFLYLIISHAFYQLQYVNFSELIVLSGNMSTLLISTVSNLFNLIVLKVFSFSTSPSESIYSTELLPCQSDLCLSYYHLVTSQNLLFNIFLFCFCGCFGQILLFNLIKEYGSLVWISISVSRQLFTILLSIFLFQHKVIMIQWCCIFVVFFGLILEIVGNIREKNKNKIIEDKKKLKDE